ACPAWGFPGEASCGASTAPTRFPGQWHRISDGPKRCRHGWRQQKTRRRPGFSMPDALRHQGDRADQAALMALMRAVRRLLWRAALFLWIRPRALKRSRIGWATAKAASAPAASLASRALRTFLTAVRSCERWAVLRALRTTVCLARFL